MKKKTIKKNLIACGVVLTAQFAQAQQAPDIWKNLSIEGQYGMNSALSPSEGITTGDYSGFNFFQLGLIYHIDDVWGVRGTFASSKFEHENINNSGVNFSRLMLEATYNILTGINGRAAFGTVSDFDITAHAGFGLGQGKSDARSGTDMIGVAQIGLMPKYNFSQNVAVFLDATFVNQFSQDFGFNGLGIEQGSGSYLNLGLGVQIRFKR
ncbi:MAG TPA: outer membrane beta-barrel protein [Flavobacterium sp.]|nr:outer membrane beta-barrel protein [Flavobacterium sp.]